ncbi:MAG TPA: cbb3-type cytochrome c oxidase subunit I [Blastocatellia bacterium]|nr:cbb3-type cytochrome c oxidase subunit I [Blastocatellia bacterium]
MAYKRLWIALCVVVVGSFAVLGGVGTRLLSNAPPIPERVVTTDGRILFDKETIQDGQNVWQSIGGQETGSIWGHGSYVAPDWTADYLHRELNYTLDKWAAGYGQASFAALNAEQQAVLKARLETVFRTNTYDAATGTLTIDPARAEAFDSLSKYYADVFANGRSEYAIPRDALTDQTKQRQMASFFWWTAWAASTNRPNDSVSYTNNWPHEPLINNHPTTSATVWSIISFILLLAGIGALVWYYSTREREAPPKDVPNNDPLLGFQPTPSQRATIKYFIVVTALIVVQILLGAVTAHYGVEGDGFYGIPSALEVVPLVLIGREAWDNIKLSRTKEWVANYRWPINFFVAVAFWNLVGAGLFGFLINPPVALYYMQGLNTTPVHGHTALFGVYGMLGIGLMLFVLRALKPGRAWKEWPLKWAFWTINIGLTMMVVLSLLPIGLMQTWASVEHGTWYARSAEFLQTGLLEKLRWLRGPGDALFAIGALLLGWFVINLFTGRSFDKPSEVESRDTRRQPRIKASEAYSGD